MAKFSTFSEEQLVFGLTIINPRTQIEGCMALETSTEDQREVVTLVPMDEYVSKRKDTVAAVWDINKESWERGCFRVCAYIGDFHASRHW